MVIVWDLVDIYYCFTMDDPGAMMVFFSMFFESDEEDKETNGPKVENFEEEVVPKFSDK